MIKSNELKTGNLVLHKGAIIVIDGIDKSNESVMVEDKHIAIPLADIEPIPLTPEWLERLGFKYSKTFRCYSVDLEILFCSEGAEYWLCDQDAGKLQKIGKPFKYVHQLQNLYFALTGEELTIKENI